MNGLARDWKRRGCHCRWEVDVEVVVQELEQLVDEEEMTVVGVGDVTLASFVDDNVEQLQVAVLGVDVVTLGVDTTAVDEPLGAWAQIFGGREDSGGLCRSLFACSTS